MKKLNLKILACTGILLSSSVFADGHSPVEFSANVGYFSDYIYRGGSQTADGAAIQGGFDMGHESGFYLGTWASNVDFGNSANIEIDFYGGIGGELPNGISWDVGALYYWYPGVKSADDAGGDFDFYDVYAGVGYTFGGDLAPSIGFGVAYTPDYFGEVGDATYFTIDLGLSLPSDVGLAFQFGYQDNDDEARAGTSYSHASVGLSKDVGIFTLDLSYYFDVDDTKEFWVRGNDEPDALVFSVSSSF